MEIFFTYYVIHSSKPLYKKSVLVTKSRLSNFSTNVPLDKFHFFLRPDIFHPMSRTPNTCSTDDLYFQVLSRLIPSFKVDLFSFVWSVTQPPKEHSGSMGVTSNTSLQYQGNHVTYDLSLFGLIKT